MPQNQESYESIGSDIGRTFIGDTHHSIDQTRLKNVLTAFANYKPEIGYVQGMNFIAALLLLQFSDE